MSFFTNATRTIRRQCLIPLSLFLTACFCGRSVGPVDGVCSGLVSDASSMGVQHFSLPTVITHNKADPELGILHLFLRLLQGPNGQWKLRGAGLMENHTATYEALGLGSTDSFRDPRTMPRMWVQCHGRGPHHPIEHDVRRRVYNIFPGHPFHLDAAFKDDACETFFLRVHGQPGRVYLRSSRVERFYDRKQRLGERRELVGMLPPLFLAEDGRPGFAQMYMRLLQYHIEYHSMMGFTRWIIYVRPSIVRSICAVPTVREWVEQGRVTLLLWDEVRYIATYYDVQATYNHAMLSLWQQHTLVYPHDLDDFIGSPHVPMANLYDHLFGTGPGDCGLDTEQLMFRFRQVLITCSRCWQPGGGGEPHLWLASNSTDPAKSYDLGHTTDDQAGRPFYGGAKNLVDPNRVYGCFPHDCGVMREEDEGGDDGGHGGGKNGLGDDPQSLHDTALESDDGPDFAPVERSCVQKYHLHNLVSQRRGLGGYEGGAGWAWATAQEQILVQY